MRISKPADLARLVKTRRQSQGRTQQDVAAAAGITRQSLARIERGHGGVSFDTLIIVFDYLGIRLEGTPVDEVGAGERLPSAGISAPENAVAGLTHGIDSSVFTQAALRQLQPSLAAVTASTRDAIRKNLVTADLTAPIRKSFSASADDAIRAQLRATIEAGAPADHAASDNTAAGRPESNTR
ncbi:MAG: helix-turn-helix transcriptional regulator [Rhodoglobus sp.]